MLLALVLGAAQAAEVTIAPYVQHVAVDRAWVLWETDGPGTPTVAFEVGGVGAEAMGSSTELGEGHWLHEVELTGLTAGTVVEYAAALDGEPAGAARFRSAPDVPESFRFVAMSDMQNASATPDKFAEVVQDGVLAWAADEQLGAPHEAFALALIPGDLVDDGRVLASWGEEFFGPVAQLSAEVPLYPVLGNHDQDADAYFRYFHLPDDAGSEHAERFYSFAHSVVLFIGLDTNHLPSWPAQLDFLDDRLDAACADPSVDFVFAQLHHPFQSELWTPGNVPTTGQVIERLEAFSTACDKPSVHFFGHTHAYSRGQSRDHDHLMVNVASAEGGLDRWGEQPQADYDAFTVSTDDWGFVVVDVTAGDDPSLQVRRLSRGNPDHPADNALTDSITVHRFGTPPLQPDMLAPTGAVSADCVVLQSTTFAAPDGAAHQATHWQVAAACDGFDRSSWEVWRQAENRYFGVDKSAGLDLTEESLRDLDEGEHCVRVRHRDAGLQWSGWSQPRAFVVAGRAWSPELLDNGDLEDGLDGWEVLDGTVELTGARRCGAAQSVQGAHAVSLGGNCAPSDSGSVARTVDLPPPEDIADRLAHYSGWTLGGAVQVAWTFTDAGGAMVGEAALEHPSAPDWAELNAEIVVPDDAVRARLTWTGSGDLDDVHLALGPTGDLPCPVVRSEPVADGDRPASDGCGCAAVTSGGGWLGRMLARR